MAPDRPWWKKKRWAAVIVLWLVVAYPLSLGPAIYLNARGWVPAAVVPVLEIVYGPLEWLAERGGPVGEALGDLVLWVDQLAGRHTASD